MTTEDGVLLRENATHTHPPSQVQAQVDRVVSTMRKRAKEEVAPIPAIYREEVQKLAVDVNSEELAARMPTFDSIRPSLCTETDASSFPLSLRQEVTSRSKDPGERHSRVNASSWLKMETLTRSSFTHQTRAFNCSLKLTTYTDGTFKTCPRLFYQIFTIHAFFHGQQFPLVYCLLPSKSREVYNRMFDILKTALQQRGCETFAP